MSNDLQQFIWPTSFACTIVTENIILPNSYVINVNVEPTTTANGNITLGFKKLRYFVESYLQNAVLIAKDNPLLPALDNVESNLVILPSDPYDYYLGCVLFSKFLAMTESYFDIGLITIDSMVGEHIQYCITDPAESGLDLTGKHWWNMDTLDTGLGSNLTWNDLNINERPKFEPRIIKGGLSENQ